MRLRHLLAATAMLMCSLAAHADTFTYTLNGGSSGFSGTGTFTGSQIGTTGSYLITSMTGTGVLGLIAPGGFNGNDNILFPNANPLFDAKGISFTDQVGSDIFKVSLFSRGTNYFALVRDHSNDDTTVPVSLSVATAATPEPSSLALLATGALGVIGAARRRIFA